MEIKEVPVETISTAATGLAIGVPALWMFFRRIILSNKITDANTHVIDLLREEVTRLNESNAKLAEQIEQLIEERAVNDRRISELEAELKCKNCL